MAVHQLRETIEAETSDKSSAIPTSNDFDLLAVIHEDDLSRFNKLARNLVLNRKSRDNGVFIDVYINMTERTEELL